MSCEKDCLFCKIIDGKIPADKVFEDDDCLAFRDINPQAPTHILLIPKKHIAKLDDLTVGDSALVGNLLCKVGDIARQEGIAGSGFRSVINCGKNAGQDVFHLHIHIMGGRKLSWP